MNTQWNEFLIGPTLTCAEPSTLRFCGERNIQKVITRAQEKENEKIANKKTKNMKIY